MNHLQKSQGFTLLELLAVILVASILGGITFVGIRTLMQRQQVAESASQLMQDIQRLRSGAVKTSRDAVLTFDSAKPNEYKISYWDGASSAVTRTVTLANGASMDIDGATGTTKLEYKAPYGELSAPNRTITVTSAAGNPRPVQKIYVVGITGQVHQ